MNKKLCNHFHTATHYSGGALAVAAPVAAAITYAVSNFMSFFDDEDYTGLTNGEISTFSSLTALGLGLAYFGYKNSAPKTSDNHAQNKLSNMFNFSVSTLGAGISFLFAADAVTALQDNLSSPLFSSSYLLSGLVTSSALAMFYGGHKRMLGNFTLNKDSLNSSIKTNSAFKP